MVRSNCNAMCKLGIVNKRVDMILKIESDNIK